MQISRIFVFGPANGSIAFQIPKISLANDDSIYLASSTFSLEPGSQIIRLTKRKDYAGYSFRVCIYRQIYEPGMQRLGHSFGAGFEFTGGAPSGDATVNTLLELLEVIQENCCIREHFCGLQQFHSFLSKEIDPSFEGIEEQLFSQGAKGTTNPLFDQNSPQICLTLNGEWSEAGTALDWFFTEPSGSVYADLVIQQPTSGQPGQQYKKVDSVNGLDRISVNKLYYTASTSSEELAVLTEQVERATAESNALSQREQELLGAERRLRERVQVLENQLAQMKASASHRALNSEALALTTNDSHSGRPQRLNSKKQITKPQAHPRNKLSDDGDASALLIIVIAVVLLLLVLGAGIAYRLYG